MSAYKFIKPNGDLIIRDPISKVPLSKDGEFKPFSGSEGTYWKRRLLDKSIVIIDKQESNNQKQDNKFGGFKR